MCRLTLSGEVTACVQSAIQLHTHKLVAPLGAAAGEGLHPLLVPGSHHRAAAQPVAQVQLLSTTLNVKSLGPGRCAMVWVSWRSRRGFRWSTEGQCPPRSWETQEELKLLMMVVEGSGSTASGMILVGGTHTFPSQRSKHCFTFCVFSPPAF